MALQIEDVSIEDARDDLKPPSTAELCEALKQVGVGQSFVIGVFNANGRNVLSIAEKLLDRKFTKNADPNGVRIGRTA